MSRFSFFRTAALLLAVCAASAASAQVPRSQLIGGTWLESPRSGPIQSYTFTSDGLYTYRTGRRSGYLTHSGTWMVTNNGTTIRILATERTERRNGQTRSIPAERVFILPVEDSGDGYIHIDGQRFGR